MPPEGVALEDRHEIRGEHEQHTQTGIHRRREHGRRADRRPDPARPAVRAGSGRRSERGSARSGWSGITGSRPPPTTPAAVKDAEVVVLAVKPQQMRAVALGLAPHLAETRPLLISVAAGIPHAALARWFGPQVPVIRTMPNRPGLERLRRHRLVRARRASAPPIGHWRR